LLSNAIKFTPSPGKIAVGVNVVRKEENGNINIRFSVEDTGIGLNPNWSSWLFKPYKQDKSVITKVSGIINLFVPFIH
jgi:signal transduction histidine kinase